MQRAGGAAREDVAGGDGAVVGAVEHPCATSTERRPLTTIRASSDWLDVERPIAEVRNGQRGFPSVKRLAEMRSDVVSLDSDLGIAGACLCGIGLFSVVPILCIAHMYVHLKLTRQPVAATG